MTILLYKHMSACHMGDNAVGTVTANYSLCYCFLLQQRTCVCFISAPAFTSPAGRTGQTQISATSSLSVLTVSPSALFSLHTSSNNLARNRMRVYYEPYKCLQRLPVILIEAYVETQLKQRQLDLFVFANGPTTPKTVAYNYLMKQFTRCSFRRASLKSIGHCRDSERECLAAVECDFLAFTFVFYV